MSRQFPLDPRQLKLHRGARKLNQEELAARLVVEAKTVSNWETGKTQPSYSKAGQIAAELGVKIADLMKPGVPESARGVPQDRLDGAVEARPFMRVPIDFRHYTGRAEELCKLESHLLSESARPVVICSVTGASGVGKSKLAAHFATVYARRFPDGVFWVEVDHQTPKEVAGLIAKELGRDVKPVDDAQAKVLIQRLLSGRRALLVLDNADGRSAAARIKNILPNEPTVAVLITTRNKSLSSDLDLGTVAVKLKEFTLDEGTELFRKVLGNDARLAREQPVLERIIEFVGGLPLLIGLLASFLEEDADVSFADLYSSLKAARPIPRWAKDQTTVANLVLDKSTEVLTPRQRKGFYALGACAPTGFSLDTAVAVAAVEESILFLDRLIALSLIQKLSGERFKLHPVIRACVRTKKGIRQADRRHAAYWCEYVHRHSSDSVQHWAHLTSEWEGIHCAWDFCLNVGAASSESHGSIRHKTEDVDVCAAGIAAGLRYFLDGRGFWQEALDRLPSSLDSAMRVGDVEQEFRIRRHFALLLRKSGRLEQAALQNLENIDVAKRAERLDWVGEEFEQLGRVRAREGNYEEAQTHYSEALRIARSDGGGGRRYEGQALNCLGQLQRQKGRYDDAIGYFEQALGLYKELKDTQGICATRAHLGSTYNDKGEHLRAVQYYSAALSVLREVGRMEVEGSLYQNIGLALERLGWKKEAVACFLLSADVCGRLGIEGWHGVSPTKERDRLLKTLGQRVDRYRSGDKETADSVLVRAREDVAKLVKSMVRTQAEATKPNRGRGTAIADSPNRR